MPPYLFWDDQNDSSRVQNAIHEAHFWVLAIVQALLVPKNEDVLITIQFHGRELIVQYLHKPWSTFLWGEEKGKK